MDRRKFLFGAGTLAACAMADAFSGFDLAEAAASGAPNEPLRLTNVNTKESYDVDLFVDGQWNPQALQVCDWLMRDWRFSKVVQCDRRIYAGLYVMQRYFGQGRRVHIHSGFRTPETNVILKEAGYNPGVNSQHLKATAVDFAIEGANVKQIAQVASVPKTGGVGCYVRMGFVHWDFRGEPVKWGDSF
jgi:uncharacterized protein YcbK (DUF882 family)